jgi:hypothetical protein
MSGLLNAWFEDIFDDLHELSGGEWFLEEPAVFRDSAFFGNDLVWTIGNYQNFDAGGEGEELFRKGHVLRSAGGGHGVIEDEEIDGRIKQEIAEGVRLGQAGGIQNFKALRVERGTDDITEHRIAF